MADLLPCPFCGGPGEVFEGRDYGTGNRGGAPDFYGCRTCDIPLDSPDQWNRRAPHDCREAVARELERLADTFDVEQINPDGRNSPALLSAFAKIVSATRAMIRQEAARIRREGVKA